MMGMQVAREPKASDFAGLKGAARARAMKRAQKMAKNDYQGARGTHFALFPGLRRSQIDTAMGDEHRSWWRQADLWARYSAQIDPAWAEPLAGALTRTTYADPHWSGSRGSAVASAKVLLYGLPIVQDRTVQWGRINPLEARDFLIRQGLVEGDIQQRFSYDDFVMRRTATSSRMRPTMRAAPARWRRPSVTRICSTSTTPSSPTPSRQRGRSGEMVEDEARRAARSAGFRSGQGGASRRLPIRCPWTDYPDHWHTLGTDGSPIDLRLSYIYDPHDPNDGVTVHVPLKALSRLTPEQFSWNVPGLLDELIVGMIKSLPKTLRVQFVPAPDTARKIRAWIDESAIPTCLAPAASRSRISPPTNAEGVAAWPDLPHAFTQAAISIVGAQIHPEVLTGELWNKLAPYLRVTFAVEQQLPPNRKNQHGRRHARGPCQNARHRQITRRTATQIRRTSQSLRTPHGRRNKPENAGDQGKFVEQANLLQQSGSDYRSTRHHALARRARHAAPARASASRHAGSARRRSCSPPPPIKSTKELTEDLQLAAVKRLLPNIDQLPDDEALAERSARCARSVRGHRVRGGA